MINNTVIIWILIPVALSGILALLQRFAKLSTAIVLVSSALLTVLAFILPEDLILSIGSRQIAFTDSLEIFGRVLKITKANLSLVGGIYLCVFLWNSLARKLETSQWFNALSLLIASLWISALAVQPFLYASVIILLVAVVSIPLLSPRGSRSGAGVLRYVTLQAIAMPPLILLSAWMLSDIETAPSASALILRATVLILGGFAIWLALFPVHTWLPMVAQESHPWTLSFLLVVMQSSLSVFFIYFFRRICLASQSAKYMGNITLGRYRNHFYRQPFVEFSKSNPTSLSLLLSVGNRLRAFGNRTGTRWRLVLFAPPYFHAQNIGLCWIKLHYRQA